MKKILILCLLLVAMVGAQNEQYHLKLLAVQETGEGYAGSDADLFLEIQPGSGRVFLETFPLTKLDTQISTRFAKDIACNHFKLDCQGLDFIYTIKAKSNIIGGPSAGAAIAALTTIAVLDLPYDSSTTITATINSGGVIGPVGGVKEKIDAAHRAGLGKVLISQGASQSSNETINFVEYGNNLSLQVQEVTDLDQVILQLTGVELNGKEILLTEDGRYTNIMSGLQAVMCDRTHKITEELKLAGLDLENNTDEYINRRQGQSRNATLDGDFYSAASFCFGSNIALKTEFYEKQNFTNVTYQQHFLILEKKVLALNKKLDNEPIDTIGDLQTYMIVKERLNDVTRQGNSFKEGSETPHILLAYGEERFFSALSWMQFFKLEGKPYNLDDESLKNSCLGKIAESEERHQYVALFLGEAQLSSIRDKIEDAKEALTAEEFALCLITAAQAKGDANAILSSLGVSQENLPAFVETKLKAVERILAENSAEDSFPILGYSYYQYAGDLPEEQIFNALIYLEYALEMGDLEIYFPDKVEYKDYIHFDEDLVIFILGMILGAALILFLQNSYSKPKSRKNDNKPLQDPKALLGKKR